MNFQHPPFPKARRATSRPIRGRIPAVALAAVLLAAAAGADSADSRGRGAIPAVVERIDQLLQDPGLKGGLQGIIVRSIQDGAVWYERNPDLLLMPASNQKLLTSSAILNALGPDWRYTTTLLREGEVDSEGVLHGDLVLKGSGDPFLAGSDLGPMVEAVRDAGIRRISGRVLGDGTRFDDRRLGVGWSWDYLDASYAAPNSALNLDHNALTVHLEPGKVPGERIHARVTPSGRYFRLRNQARTAAPGAPSTLVVTRPLGSAVIAVDGALAVDAPSAEREPARMSVDDPARFAAFVLAEKLRMAGVAVDGPAEPGRAAEGAVEIVRTRSAPLSDMLAKLNKPSDNLAAECFLKTLGAETGRKGATAGGRDAALEWFASIGMDPAGIDMEDGSGLSRLDGVTPRNLAILLLRMASHPCARVFRESLPIAGVDGTLRSRMKGTPAEGNCRAKTGYVGYVSSLSGYVSTADGEPLVIVMLMNNHRSRNAVPMGVQNRIVEYLAAYRRQP